MMIPRAALLDLRVESFATKHVRETCPQKLVLVPIAAPYWQPERQEQVLLRQLLKVQVILQPLEHCSEREHSQD